MIGIDDLDYEEQKQVQRLINTILARHEMAKKYPAGTHVVATRQINIIPPETEGVITNISMGGLRVGVRWDNGTKDGRYIETYEDSFKVI